MPRSTTVLAYLRQQRDDVEAAYLYAVANKRYAHITLLHDKLVNLVDEIARLEGMISDAQ